MQEKIQNRDGQKRKLKKYLNTMHNDKKNNKTMKYFKEEKISKIGEKKKISAEIKFIKVHKSKMIKKKHFKWNLMKEILHVSWRIREEEKKN